MSTREQTDNGTRIVETETEARQGVELHRMRYVLAFGAGGAFIALMIAALAWIA